MYTLLLVRISMSATALQLHCMAPTALHSLHCTSRHFTYCTELQYTIILIQNILVTIFCVIKLNFLLLLKISFAHLKGSTIDYFQKICGLKSSNFVILMTIGIISWCYNAYNHSSSAFTFLELKIR